MTWYDNKKKYNKKRYLRSSIDYTLTALAVIQFMLLAADPTAEQMKIYIPVQIVNILVLILNLSILRKYSRLCNE